MEKLLASELHPDEHVVWCQQPRPIVFARASSMEFFFGIPFFSLPAFVFYNLVLHQVHQTAWSALLLVFCFLGLFMTIGAGLLLSPLFAYWKALRTVYAVTNERCIIIAAPWRRTIRSYLAGDSLGDIVELHRIEDSHGRGDLVFHKVGIAGGKGGIRYYDVGFIGIVGVREAEEKVRKLITTTKHRHESTAC